MQIGRPVIFLQLFLLINCLFSKFVFVQTSIFLRFRKVTIKEQDNSSLEILGIAVMVPEQSLDEAHAIIESQNTYDDFCDLIGDDESFDNGDDIYDDQFNDEY